MIALLIDTLLDHSLVRSEAKSDVDFNSVHSVSSFGLLEFALLLW